MESETWAFIDEYGNPNLDTEVKDVSTFFIVSAVMVAHMMKLGDALETTLRRHQDRAVKLVAAVVQEMVARSYAPVA